MAQSRLDRLKKDIRTTPLVQGDTEGDELYKLMKERQDKVEKKPTPAPLEVQLLQLSKEVVFDVIDNNPVFYLAIYTFDLETAYLTLTTDLILSFTDDEKDDSDDKNREKELCNQVKRFLAMAMIHEVPVYANTDNVAEKLSDYQSQMLREGFDYTMKSGAVVKVKLTTSNEEMIGSVQHLSELSATKMLSPAEIPLIKDAVQRELKRHQEAGRIITSLKIAIDKLAKLLAASKRNEGALQNCLTGNPILFGTQYVKVIPKYKLGKEFEMDYALERYDGLIDMVEIEASNHLLYTTSKGNPSQHLVHAEQQVLDWMDWVEKNNSYARKGHCGLLSPKAFVVIGCSDGMSDEELGKLKRRNLSWRGSLEILTYNDLLEKGKSLLALLTAEPSEKSSS